jgi:hypothetical protein
MMCMGRGNKAPCILDLRNRQSGCFKRGDMALLSWKLRCGHGGEESIPLPAEEYNPYLSATSQPFSWLITANIYLYYPVYQLL